MNKKLVVALALGIFLFSFVSAEIFLIKQPEDVYSFGDNLEVVLGSDGNEGWASIDLVCSGGSENLYLQYIYDETQIPITAPLTKDFLGNLEGECKLELVYAGVAKDSLSFEISDDVDINIQFNQNNFFPDEEVRFEGSAIKANGDSLKGSVEVAITNLGIEHITEVINGEFSGGMEFPTTIAAGEYNLEVKAFELDSEGNTQNSGEGNFSIIILQKPTSLQINAPEEVNPGTNLDFSSTLFDQAGDNMSVYSVAYTLVSVDGSEELNILSDTDELNSFPIKKDAAFGYWNLSAESEDLADNIQVYVNKNREASFEIVNETLTILNVGNVPYDKIIEISIGDHSEIKHVNLSLGNSLELELSAPDGEYDIEVSDGNSIANARVPLTGNAISIQNSRGRGIGFSGGGSIAWVFVILVLGLFIFISGRRVINRKSVLFMDKLPTMGRKLKTKDKGGVVHITPSKGKDKPKVSTGNFEAAPSLVLSGEKQASAVIALKVKNYSEVNSKKSNAEENLDEIVSGISENNGRVYKRDGIIIGIFAPSITRTFDNGLTAIKVAQSIAGKIREHNKKFNQKIEYGIGVNSGDIIARKHGEKLLFTPVGNVLSHARHVSDIAENEVLLSEAANKSLRSKVKTTQNPEKFNTKTYSVAEILDNKQNNKFIQGFLERNEYKKMDDFKL